MDKRGVFGLTLEQIIGLIFAALTIVLVVVFLWNHFNPFAGEVRDDAACEASIVLAASMKSLPTPGGTGKQLYPLQCKRGELVFTKKALVKQDKIDHDLTDRMITDSLVRCWKKVGAGTKDPFANWNNAGESYCLLCDVIKYDEDLQTWMQQKITDDPRHEYSYDYTISSPNYYWATQKIPSGKDKGVTYWEYLFKEKPPVYSATDIQDLKKIVVAPGSVTLVQMYKMDSKSSTGLLVKGGIGALVLIAGSVVALPAAGILVPLGIIGSWLLGSELLVTSLSAGFKDCPDCNGIGQVTIVPSNQAFSVETLKNIGGKEIKVPLCTILVN